MACQIPAITFAVICLVVSLRASSRGESRKVEGGGEGGGGEGGGQPDSLLVSYRLVCPLLRVLRARGQLIEPISL